jgi:hypothetical protein
MDMNSISPKDKLLVLLLALLSAPVICVAQNAAKPAGDPQAATKRDSDASPQSNVQAPASTVRGPLLLEADPTFESSPRAAATKNFVLSHTEISVTDFGAVGDGKTDNRTAFNNAILYAKANGKTLFVPAGNFYLSDAVDFHGVAIHGVDGLGGTGPVGSTLIGAPCHDVIASPEAAETGITKMGGDYFSIRNLTVMVDASRDATAQFNSVVSTSGRTVKWVSGSKFACLVNGPGAATVRINGSDYTVSGTPTDTSITVTTELPSLSNATLWSAGTFVNRKRWALQRSAFANNPAAWTGQKLGAAKPVGATAITLANAPLLNQSWGVAANGAVKIGSNVCNYYGIVGAVLQNVTCGLQGTTDAAGSVNESVTPVNPWLYTDTEDDLPGAEVGNVAFAFPSRDANHAHNSMTGSFHENIRVLAWHQLTGNNANNTGGWFTQITPYAAHFRNLMARGTTFGFIEAQTAMNVDQEIRGQGTQDAAVFEGFEMHSPVPFVGVSGDFVHVSNFQLYSGTYDPVHVPSRGLILLEPSDPTCSGCLFKNMPMGGWVVSNMYNEPGYVGKYFGPYAQIQGGTMTFIGGMMASQPGPVIWDAVASATYGTSLNSGVVPAVIINGAGNKFHNAGVNNTAGQAIDNSQGGTEWDGLQSYGIKDTFQLPARFGPANRIDGAFLRTMSFGADAYQSGEGLFLSPENIVSWLTIGTQHVVHDATAPITGQYLVLPAHPGVDLLGRLNGYDGWKVGSSFPAGTGTIVVKARPKQTTSGTLEANSKHGQIGSSECSLKAGEWSACTVRYDSTKGAQAGDEIKVIGKWNGTDNAFTPATEIDVAYVAAIPDFNSINVANLKVSGSATLAADPTADMQAATKHYVDTHSGGASPHSGDAASGSESDIAFSVSPVFNAGSKVNYITLAGNVSSSKLAAGGNGQEVIFVICQDAKGGHTFTWPGSVRGGGTVGAAASSCSTQNFFYVGALAKWVSLGAMQTGL